MSSAVCFGVCSSYNLGLFFILLVSLIWSAASILVQFLYTKQSFDSPFLLTYIGVSLFTILLPTKYALEQLKSITTFLFGEWTHKGSSTELEITTASPDLGQYENIPAVEDHITASSQEQSSVDDYSIDHIEESPSQQVLEPWTTSQHMYAALKIAPVWFVANWSYNASLAYTSITSSTVLASTGSLFTFLFAVMYRDEQFTCLKFVGVLLGVAGSMFTALHDASSSSSEDDEAAAMDELTQQSSDETLPSGVRMRMARYLLVGPAYRDDSFWSQERALFGDALGLLSAIGYGGYAVMVRVLCPRDESLMSMELLLGYIGLFNMVALSPILFYQLFQGNHSHLTWVIFGFLVVKGLLDNVLSDYLWARSVVLTSATVATVGLGLTIPLAFMSDVLWTGQEGDQVVSLSSVSGALSVLAGFVLVNIATDKDSTDNPISIAHAIDEHEDEEHEEPIQLTNIKRPQPQVAED